MLSIAFDTFIKIKYCLDKINSQKFNNVINNFVFLNVFFKNEEIFM